MRQAKYITVRRRQRGFTIIELMITLTMVAILASIAAPSMRTFVLNSRITSTTQELVRSIQTARTEAMKRQARVVICASADPTSNNSTCATSGVSGWIVFVDTTADEQRATDGTETLIEARSFDSSKLSILADQNMKLSYAATGFADSTATNSNVILLCDSRGVVDASGGTTQTNSVARGISIAGTGRTTLISILSTLASWRSANSWTC